MNGASITDEVGISPDWLSKTASFFGSLQRDFSVYVPSCFTGLHASLVSGQYEKRIGFPTMVHADPGMFRGVMHDIEAVESPDQLRELSQVSARCFEIPAATAGISAALFSGARANERWQAYLMRYQESVVGMSMCFVEEEFGVVDFVATIPEFRERGIGTCLTRAAVAGAIQLGATIPVLHASAAGFPVYSALGFRMIGSTLVYSRGPGRLTIRRG